MKQPMESKAVFFFSWLSWVYQKPPAFLVATRYSDPDLPQLLPLPARPSSSYEPRPKVWQPSINSAHTWGVGFNFQNWKFSTMVFFTWEKWKQANLVCPFFCCTNLWGLSYLNSWDPCYVVPLEVHRWKRQRSSRMTWCRRWPRNSESMSWPLGSGLLVRMLGKIVSDYDLSLVKWQW